jgi:hypothetical protein
MIPQQHTPAHASASTLIAPSVIVHLPARVPLDAPAGPMVLESNDARMVRVLLLLTMVAVWFLTA